MQEHFSKLLFPLTSAMASGCPPAIATAPCTCILCNCCCLFCEQDTCTLPGLALEPLAVQLPSARNSYEAFSTFVEHVDRLFAGLLHIR